MAKVPNWQLKRKMQYRFEDARPDRQFGAVFDINRCIGCQTCTMACRSTWTFSNGQEYMWWNNVETKPFGGYPQQWDAKLLAKLGRQEWSNGKYAGKTIFEKADGELREEPKGFAPKEPEWRFPNIYEDTATGTCSKGMSLPAHNNFFFTFSESAITVHTQPAWRLVHATRSISGRKTVSCWWIKRDAADTRNA